MNSSSEGKKEGALTKMLLSQLYLAFGSSRLLSEFTVLLLPEAWLLGVLEAVEPEEDFP